MAELKIVLRGHTAHAPWNTNWPCPHEREQTPHELRVYPAEQTQAPSEITSFDPQVKQLPLLSRS
jgi:hypothetical protein